MVLCKKKKICALIFKRLRHRKIEIYGFLVLSDEAEFCYKVNDFWHPNDEGGMAWNDPEIGIEWPELKGEYKGSASEEGYTLEDGTALNLSDKDQKWLGLKDTFKF